MCPKSLVSYLVFGFKYLYSFNHQKHNSVRKQVASAQESRTETKLMVKAIRKVPGWKTEVSQTVLMGRGVSYYESWE